MSGSDTAPSTETRPDGADPDTAPPLISALHTSPERVILTEDGNADGWLVSDVAVGVDESV